MKKKLGLSFKGGIWVGLPVLFTLSLPVFFLPSAHATNPPATQPAATQAASHAKPRLDDAAVLAFLKQYEPEVYDGALVLQTKDPAKFADMLKAFNSDCCNLLDIQKRNEPLFQVTVQDRRLGYQAFQLSKELRDTVLTAEVHHARAAQLRQVVAQQFVNRQKKREMELAEMQNKLDDLRRELEDRQIHEDALITQRIDELLNKTPKMEW